MVVVGFDVGSQTSRVSVCIDGRVSEPSSSTISPTIVSLTDQLLVGRDACREVETRHCNTLRHLTASLRTRRRAKLCHRRGEKEVSVELALAMIFEKLKRSVSSHGTIKSCNVSIPSGLSAMEVERLRTAAAAVGLNDVSFIPSTLAASMHYSRSQSLRSSSKPQRCLVVDVGCRFTSASIIDVSKYKSDIVATRAMRQGGYDIDKMFLKNIEIPNVYVYHPVALTMAVEKAKKDLSSLREAVVELSDSKISVRREQLNKGAKPFLDKLSAMIGQLTAAHPDVSVALLVGGVGRMLTVRELVQSGGGRGMNLPIEVMDYDYSCVQGCARWEGEKHQLLNTPAASPFRFWTTDGTSRAPVPVFTEDIKDTLRKGSTTMFQQLIDYRGDETLSDTDIQQATETDLLSPALPPLDGCLVQECESDATVLYDVRGMEKHDWRLGLCSVPFVRKGKLKFVNSLVMDAARVGQLEEDIREVKEQRRQVEERAERRNGLEEAFLRADDVEMECLEQTLPSFAKYLELANTWLDDSSAFEYTTMRDFEQLTDLVNLVVDDYEGDYPGTSNLQLIHLCKTLGTHFEEEAESMRECSSSPRGSMLRLRSSQSQKQVIIDESFIRSLQQQAQDQDAQAEEELNATDDVKEAVEETKDTARTETKEEEQEEHPDTKPEDDEEPPAMVSPKPVLKPSPVPQPAVDPVEEAKAQNRALTASLLEVCVVAESEGEDDELAHTNDTMSSTRQQQQESGIKRFFSPVDEDDHERPGSPMRQASIASLVTRKQIETVPKQPQPPASPNPLKVTPALVRSPAGGYERRSDLESSVKLNSNNQPEIHYAAPSPTAKPMSSPLMSARRRSSPRIEIDPLPRTEPAQPLPGAGLIRQNFWLQRKAMLTKEREIKDAVGMSPHKRRASLYAAEPPVVRERRGSVPDGSTPAPQKEPEKARARVREASPGGPMRERRATLGDKNVIQRRARAQSIGRVDVELAKRRKADAGAQETDAIKKTKSMKTLLSPASTTGSGSTSGDGRAFQRHATAPTKMLRRSPTADTQALNSARRKDTPRTNGKKQVQVQVQEQQKEVEDYSSAREVSFISGGDELVEFVSHPGFVALKVNKVTLLEAVALKYNPKRNQLVAYKVNDERGTGGQLPDFDRRIFIIKLAAVAANAGVECRGFGHVTNPSPKEPCSPTVNFSAATKRSNPVARQSYFDRPIKRDQASPAASEDKRKIVDTVMEIFNMK